MELKIHPDLQKHIWPLRHEEFNQLEENILAEGIRDKIIIWQGYIVDGHNRFIIAQKHNIPYEVEEYEFENIEAVKDWMDRNQLGRRNLTQDQWQISIGRRYNREKLTQGGDRKSKDQIDTLIDASQAIAEEYKISAPTVKRYAKKAEEFEEMQENEPDLAGDIWSGQKSMKEVKRDVKKNKQKKHFEELKQKELQPPTDNNDVIVIDPPWQMEKIERDIAPDQVGFDYPTMTIDEIKNFKLPAADNCHVFMWITHKNLPHGFDIFNSWGVKYVCCFVWHKNGGFQPFGLPQYNCEFILYGRIGTPVFCDLKDFNVCFNADRAEHSVKPNKFYETIKRVTAGKRMDIFNRRDIDGFDKWGNEA